jgi:hypothetical protein
MPVDLTGFRRKMNAAGGLLSVVKPLLQDAGQYMEARIADDVLNGEDGKEYPKNYPASVSQGATGFVGVVSGNLKRSIQTREKGYTVLILSDARAAPVATYNIVIDNWAREKYGMGIFEISIELYGGVIEKAFRDTLTDFARAASAGKRFNYSNPFPA